MNVEVKYKPVPADRPARITEQDAREIGANFYYAHVKPEDEKKVIEVSQMLSIWMSSNSGKFLLSKLNADREQVPAVAVPEKTYFALADEIFELGVDAPVGEAPNLSEIYAILDKHLVTTVSHSQQSAEAHDKDKNAQRYLWIKENIQEELTQESLKDSEYAEHKTCYKLPLLISWADFCGHISLDDAIDNQISRGDRCPSHESEKGGEV